MIFLVSGLLFFLGLGLPASYLLPESVPDRLAGAPIFGLAIFSIAATIAYMYGALPATASILTIVALISLIVCFAISSQRAWLASLLGSGILVGAACLAPLWIGGWQFAIFQGNPSDQFNYISMASIYSARSYAEVVAQGTSSDLIALRLAASQLGARPAVAIVLGVFRPLFFATTAEASYPYLALLQTLSLYGILFAIKNLFVVGRFAGLLVAGAFALGFYAQYVLDINAWSSLAAFGLNPTCVTLVFLLSTGTINARAIIPLAIVAASILYVYPESASICAVLAAVIVGYAIVSKKARAWTGVASIITAAGIALLVCAPAWQATINFLLSQIVSAHSVPKSWFFVFDRFYIGATADLMPIDDHTTAFSFLRALSSSQIASVLCSAVVAVFGVFFIAPRVSSWTFVNALWNVADIMFVVGLVVSAISELERQSAAPFLKACMFALLLPVFLLTRGDYWSAGKALSMLGPFTFIASTYPVLLKRNAAAIAAVLLVSLHLAFGLQRLTASENGAGVRGFGGYPASLRLKRLYRWQPVEWRDQMAGCRRVAMLVDDPYIARLVETIAIDLDLQVEFLTDRKVEYSDGVTIAAQVSSHSSDCSLTDHMTSRGEGRVIELTAAHNSSG